MALFSLLLALIIERTAELGPRWQFQYWLDLFYQRVALTLERTSASFAVLLIFVPALLTYGLLRLVDGLVFGLFSLVLWVVITLVCIACVGYRKLYKQYLLSVCHQDTQGSYHIAAQLLDVESVKVNDQCMLATRVGRQLAWINYRYYCAVVLMMIIGGPVAVVFYTTLRTLDLMMFKQDIIELNWVKRLLFLIDWLPARIVAFAYVLVGNFSHAVPVWFSLCSNVKLPAYDVVSKVAMAAEQIAKDQDEDQECVTMAGTCRLVQLAKRTLLLLAVMVSMLTIFGVLL